MPKFVAQDNNWNFVVAPQRLFLEDKTPTRCFANVRLDTREVLGQVSENGYGLVQNFDFISTIRKSLDGLGLVDYKEDILSIAGGKRLMANYDFNNRIKTINKVGDKVGLMLRFFTGFDAKTSATGELFLKELKCLNGMVVPESRFQLQKRHDATFNLDFVKQVTESAVKDFDKGLQIFEKLADISITDEQGANLLGRIGISDAVLKKMRTLWISPNFATSRNRTLYALYDAVSETCRDIESTRVELATRINRMSLHKIASALDPDSFAELVKPLPKKETAISTEFVASSRVTLSVAARN